MELLSSILQFIVCITIIVGLHEWGHMATAKWFGMRVEKYYIGFPPRIFSFKRGDTEYGIGAIPLGGFVKISGMMDESMDKEQMSLPPQPHEFRSKPAWQRLIVMLGGIIVNVITGILVFIMWFYFTGESFTPMQEVNKQGIAAYPIAETIGLQSGDKILKFNGKEVKYLEDAVGAKVLLGSDGHYVVEREGKEKRIDIPNGLVEKLNTDLFISPFWEFEVDRIAENSPAEKAGFKKGDKIVSFNGKPIRYYHEFEKEKVNIKGKTVAIVLERAGKPIESKVTLDKDGKLGFYAKYKSNVKSEVKLPSFGDAIAGGTSKAFGSVLFNMQGMGKVVKGEVSVEAVSGPLGMYRIFPPDWSRFWIITATLSMWLAFINVLPIPALDGGHALFTIIEMISGRKIPEKILERAQIVGMVLLLGLMVFILGLDLFKMFRSIWTAIAG